MAGARNGIMGNGQRYRLSPSVANRQETAQMVGARITNGESTAGTVTKPLMRRVPSPSKRPASFHQPGGPT
jgi:hypothetical protein